MMELYGLLVLVAFAVAGSVLGYLYRADAIEEKNVVAAALAAIKRVEEAGTDSKAYVARVIKLLGADYAQGVADIEADYEKVKAAL